MVKTFIETILTKLNSTLRLLYPSEDKFMHLICGLVISALLLPFVGVYSALWVAVVGAVKEGYDYLNKENHTVDVWDWVATVVGGVVPLIPLMCL